MSLDTRYQFSQDNTQGLSDAELSEMNAELERRLTEHGFAPDGENDWADYEIWARIYSSRIVDELN